MVSKIKTDVLETVAGGPVHLTGQESIKASANLNGVTSTLRASFNISSFTDNASGNFTFSFSNVMANANYIPNPEGDYDQTATAGSYSTQCEASLTASSIKVVTMSSSSVLDCQRTCCCIVGDLA